MLASNWHQETRIIKIALIQVSQRKKIWRGRSFTKSYQQQAWFSPCCCHCTCCSQPVCLVKHLIWGKSIPAFLFINLALQTTLEKSDCCKVIWKRIVHKFTQHITLCYQHSLSYKCSVQEIDKLVIPALEAWLWLKGWYTRGLTQLISCNT